MNLTEFIITSAVLGILYLLITYIGNNATIRLLYGIYFLIYTGYNAYTILFKTVDLIGNSLSFSNYIVEAKEKLIKLGGNPEDLDKEETKA